jgi:uncharacterized protein DUF362
MTHPILTNHGISRRGFLLGAGAGLAAGVPLAWLGATGNALIHGARFTGQTQEVKKPLAGMPGPFPGRVIEVRHPGCVRDDYSLDTSAIKDMMGRGMTELTGADHPSEAWQRFFEPGDVVGIKVNPVGRKYSFSKAAAVSSPPVLLEVVAGLKSAGVKPADIIIFERYLDQFLDVYGDLLSEPALDGVRWLAASATYDNHQLDIEGYPQRGDRSRNAHLAGYDPDVFVHMGYAHPQHHPKDDRRLRSHLTTIVSRMVNKFVTIPVLKDHGSGGVTLALKNLSHGLNNNVNRSHLERFTRLDGAVSGPNQCNTFIPTAAGQDLIRQKATLHILDGLVGVYEGGPSSRHTWSNRALFFATDPVALDHVGWDIVDAKRLAMGLPPVGRTGLAFNDGTLDRRQPEHIILAASIGMGIFEAGRIEHRRIELKA